MSVQSEARRELPSALTVRRLRTNAMAVHFPTSIAQLRKIVNEAVSSLDDAELEWVSSNRDFAETERYVIKDAVDESLVGSPLVQSECARIELLFRDSTPWEAGRRYLPIMHAELQRLHDMHVEMLRHSPSASIASWKQFWPAAFAQADVDNAHAMYLSSDNWPFSVFHGLIATIEAATGGDVGALAAILSGGIQDPRTAVFSRFGDEYRGLSRLDFARELRRKREWVDEDGIMPLLVYKAACTADAPAEDAEQTVSALRLRFTRGVESVSSVLGESERREFQEVISVFTDLYAARAAYDVYQYFGFYAFARHVLILRTMRSLAELSGDLAEEFHHAASTYQFQRAGQLLDRIQ